ncbi:MAG: putative sulfate exporter family transporter [Zetaproteobacteria bacterium]|nr:putative sulfate exporter family transporter [Zetaproteobacteria bacterium]
MIAKIGPGLLLAYAVGMLGKYFSQMIPSVNEVSLAILLGILLGGFVPKKEVWKEGLLFGEKKILSLAVLLMGFEMNISILTTLGIRVIFLIALIVASTVLIAAAAGKVFQVRHSLSMLLGMGNAICGSSAIAASAPILSKEPEDVGLAIGTTNLLGTIALFLLPFLCQYYGLNIQQSSFLIGGSLQAIGHVVAAGYTLGEEVGEMATAIKMARVCFLIPALVLLSKFYHRENKQKGLQATLQILPPFLYGFVLCALLAFFGFIPPQTILQIKFVSHLCILIAMASIGLRIQLRDFIRQGPQALMVGGMSFILQILVLVVILTLVF